MKGRINYEETAALLGVKPGDIPVLIAARLIRPLGHPPSGNSVKYFAYVDILKKVEDEHFLSRMQDALYRFHRIRNATSVANSSMVKRKTMVKQADQPPVDQSCTTSKGC